MKRVVLAPKARAFLLSEASYLRDHSPSAAHRFLERMREARRALGRFDQIGFAHDALPILGIRRLIVDDYILVYLPKETVMIVAIRHSRQTETAIVGDDTADFEVPPAEIKDG